jgi:hypothetical protein
MTKRDIAMATPLKFYALVFWFRPNGYFIADGACTCRECSTQFRADRVQQFIQAGDDCLL